MSSVILTILLVYLCCVFLVMQMCKSEFWSDTEHPTIESYGSDEWLAVILAPVAIIVACVYLISKVGKGIKFIILNPVWKMLVRTR